VDISTSAKLPRAPSVFIEERLTSDVVVPHALDRQARLMLQAALLIFVWTIEIGILNGLDLVEFTDTQLLSHLHGGTLGWLTLGILSFTLWLFGGQVSGRSKRFMEVFGALAVVSIASYVFAFALTTGIVRPIAGTLTLVSLVGFAGWTITRIPHVTLTVPHLFALVGLAVSVLGGVLGVINGLAIARGLTWVPDTFFEAHPGTMEIGFVLPVAMGLSEWGLRRGMPDEPASDAGIMQVGVMFIAFVLVLYFILARMDDLIGLATLLAVAGVVIFWVRMWRIGLGTSLLRRSPHRHALMGGLMVGVTLIYVTVIIMRAEGQFELIPRGQQLAFIHLMAIGTTTNALLAYVTFLSSRASAPNVLDDIVFWGVNLGVIGFATVLTFDLRAGIHAFVPIMGAALLTAIVVHIVRLNRDLAVPPGLAGASEAPPRLAG
jgi:hypothetical protein